MAGKFRCLEYCFKEKEVGHPHNRQGELIIGEYKASKISIRKNRFFWVHKHHNKRGYKDFLIYVA